MKDLAVVTWRYLKSKYLFLRNCVPITEHTFKGATTKSMKLYTYKFKYDNRKVNKFEECVETERYLSMHLGHWTSTDVLEEADVAFIPLWNASLRYTHPALHRTEWKRTVEPLLKLESGIPHFTIWAYVLWDEDFSYIPKQVAIWAFESEVSMPGTMKCADNGCSDRMVVIPYSLSKQTHVACTSVTQTQLDLHQFEHKTWHTNRPTKLVYFSSAFKSPDANFTPRKLRDEVASKLNAVRYNPKNTDPNAIFPTAQCIMVARGDTPTRKCFYQAIAHGCFPVVTHDALLVYTDLFRGNFAREIESVAIVLPIGGLLNPPDIEWFDAQLDHKLEHLETHLKTMMQLATTVLSYYNNSVVQHALWATTHMSRKMPLRSTTYTYPISDSFNTAVLPVTISDRETVTRESSSQYLTEPILHDAFENYDRRVAVLEKASIAFIPLYTFLVSWKPKPKFYNVDHCVQQIKEVQKAIPSWKTSTIPHVLVFGDVLWDDRRVFWPHVDLPTNTVIVALEKASKCPYRTISVPFPCGPVPDIPDATRTHTLCYIGRQRTISDTLNSTPGCKLAHLNIPGWQTTNQDDKLIWSTYHTSKFSWQPHGDRQTRRGFYHSILAGCIPVVTHENVNGYTDVLEGRLHLEKACVVLPFAPQNAQQIVQHLANVNTAPIMNHMKKVTPYLADANKMFSVLIKVLVNEPWELDVQQCGYECTPTYSLTGPIGLSTPSALFETFNKTYEYHGHSCLMGNLKSHLTNIDAAQNVDIVNFNFRQNFNGLTAVTWDNMKAGRPLCLAKSNHYYLEDHKKPYNDRYGIYNNLAFGYAFLCDKRDSMHTLKEAALFANPFSGTNLGHDISYTLFMIYWYKERKLTCPILLLSRVRAHPRILEILRIFLDPELFRFMPDEAVWHIGKIHMFDSVKDSAFFNIARFPDMLNKIKSVALETYGDCVFPPNIFLGKTHEQVQVLASETAIKCPELLARLRQDPSWIIVNPEDREMTLMKLIAMLQKAQKIVTTTGSISYAHELFFSKDAKWFFLQTHQAPYHFREKYIILRVNKTVAMSKSETEMVLNLIT